MIRIYTDGAAQGNPGPGGYGTIMKYGQHEKEFSAGFRLTTNNRMELMAVIVGLEAIKKDGLPITIYSDSKYVVDSVEKGWIWGWEKKKLCQKKPTRICGNATFRYTKGSNRNLSGSKAMPVIRKMSAAMC